MTRSDDRAIWIAGLVLAVAGVLVLSLTASGSRIEHCLVPPDEESLPMSARATKILSRNLSAFAGIVDWSEIFWSPKDESAMREVAQIVVAHDATHFVFDPMTILPAQEQPLATLEVQRIVHLDPEVAAHVRSSERATLPFAAAWIYFLGGEPVANPVTALIRHAFEHPLTPAPAITLLSATSDGGSMPLSEREAVAMDRLRLLWRDWSQMCGG